MKVKPIKNGDKLFRIVTDETPPSTSRNNHEDESQHFLQYVTHAQGKGPPCVENTTDFLIPSKVSDINKKGKVVNKVKLKKKKKRYTKPKVKSKVNSETKRPAFFSFCTEAAAEARRTIAEAKESKRSIKDRPKVKKKFLTVKNRHHLKRNSRLNSNSRPLSQSPIKKRMHLKSLKRRVSLRKKDNISESEMNTETENSRLNRSSGMSKSKIKLKIKSKIKCNNDNRDINQSNTGNHSCDKKSLTMKHKPERKSIASQMGSNNAFNKEIRHRRKEARMKQRRILEKKRLEKQAIIEEENALDKEPSCESCGTMATKLGGICPPRPPKPQGMSSRFQRDNPHLEWKKAGSFAKKKYRAEYEEVMAAYKLTIEKYNDDRRADPGWGVLNLWGERRLCKYCIRKSVKCTSCLAAPGTIKDPVTTLLICVGCNEERRELEEEARQKKLEEKLSAIKMKREEQKKKRQEKNRERARQEMYRRTRVLKSRIAAKLRDIKEEKSREWDKIRASVDDTIRQMEKRSKAAKVQAKIDRNSGDPLRVGMICRYHNRDSALRSGAQPAKNSAKNKAIAKAKKAEARRKADMAGKPGWGLSSFVKRKAKERQKKKDRERRILEGHIISEEDDTEEEEEVMKVDLESSSEEDSHDWEWVKVKIKRIHIDGKSVDVEYSAKTYAGTTEPITELKVSRKLIEMLDGTDTWGIPIDEDARNLSGLVKPKPKVPNITRKNNKQYWGELFEDTEKQIVPWDNRNITKLETKKNAKPAIVWERLTDSSKYTGTARMYSESHKKKKLVNQKNIDLAINPNRLDYAGYAAKLEGQEPPEQLTAKQKLVRKAIKRREIEAKTESENERLVLAARRRLRESHICGDKGWKESDKLYNRMSLGWVHLIKRSRGDAVTNKEKIAKQLLAEAKAKMIEEYGNLTVQHELPNQKLEWKDWYRKIGEDIIK